MEKIVQYNPTHRELVEKFLITARDEGSAGTYTQKKFNLDDLDSKSSLWLAIVDDEVASITTKGGKRRGTSLPERPNSKNSTRSR